MGWTPYEAPHLIAKTVTELEALWAMADKLKRLTDAKRIEPTRDFPKALNTAPVTWLDKDVCELITDTFDRVPEWSAEGTAPSPHGLILFAKPLMTVSAPQVLETGKSDMATVDGFLWDTRGTEITVWAINNDAHYGMTTLDFPLFTIFDSTSPGGAGAVGVGTGKEALETDTDKLLSLVGATWLLLTQPRVMDEAPPAVVTVKRKPVGAVKREKKEVRVSVRTLAGNARTARRAGEPRKATSRWWVRGHWRQQAWGKGRKLRRPVYIAAHLAGNPDSEVDQRPQVQVVRRGE